MDSTDKPLILSPLRRTIHDAITFAHAAHAGQVDKAGAPYTMHLFRVARAVQVKLADWGEPFGVERDEAVQIAWLHDVIEDTTYTADDLRAEGFSYDVARGVEDLSRNGPGKRPDWPYLDFVRWIGAHGPLPTILVKLSDNKDNSDPERLALLPEKDRVRLSAKYEASMAILREAAVAKGWKP